MYVAREADLDQTELLPIHVQTVGLGVDRRAIDRQEMRQEIGKLFSGVEIKAAEEKKPGRRMRIR